MGKLGVEVTTGETAQSAGFSTSTGTLFVAGAANYGPETTTDVKSLNEFVNYYGPREGTTVKTYDEVNAFFALGGSRAYVSRALGASIAAAKKELETAGKTKVLVVTAKYKGEYGNKLKVEVEEVGSETRLIVFNPEGEVLVKSPLFLTAEAMLKWGTEAANKTYVEVTEGSNYSSGKAELVKKVASAALTGGVNPTTTKATTITAIEAPAKSLGPGTIVCTVPTTQFETGVWTALAEAAQKNNRFALADMKKAEEAGSTAAEIKTERETVSLSTILGGYIAFFATAVKASGLTLGTERTIAASGVVAGLLAKVAATGNDNTAPAGPKWPTGPFVLSLVNTYPEASMNELNEAGVNNLVERRGATYLYGDVTATSQSKDLIFWQYSAARERMRLVAECEKVGERFLFSTLDGRHQKRAKFAGELQGVIKRHWEAGALYGETAAEAGIVNVSEPINTPATEQAGELNAELIVRISPVAQTVKIVITSTPITESV